MAGRQAELDVRIVPPARRHEEIFARFEALVDGESFVLVNDHYPRPLLYQFQAQYPGAFDWNVLEAGPGRFRIEICRRTGESTRSVAEYLEADHRRLDDLLPTISAITDGASLAGAGRLFREFACGLNQHIEAEERVLFPAFEELTGMANGPTAVMCAEHVEIRQLIALASAAIDTQEAGAFRDAVERLIAVLSMHNVKEEQILYPMTDRAIATPSGRDALVRQMQAV